jgi:hypothetical protein
LVVKPREPSESPADDGANGAAPETIALMPPARAAVCISKPAHMDVLRPFLPGMSVIEIIDDRENGETSLHTIAPGPDGEGRGGPTPSRRCGERAGRNAPVPPGPGGPAGALAAPTGGTMSEPDLGQNWTYTDNDHTSEAFSFSYNELGQLLGMTGSASEGYGSYIGPGSYDVGNLLQKGAASRATWPAGSTWPSRTPRAT